MVGQHVFDHHAHQHFVLDNKDPPTGKQFGRSTEVIAGQPIEAFVKTSVYLGTGN
jgi:hypothetical protein